MTAVQTIKPLKTKNKMCEHSSNSSSGVGLLGLLGVAFVVLKLIGTITWSWWWVTAPFWSGLALLIIVLLIIGAIAWATK